MPKILFVEHNGVEYLVDAPVGTSLMQAAIDNNVTGITGDCGGCCSCATCHGYIAPEWVAVTGKPNADELALLDGALHVKDTSRLTCQVIVTENMNGLRVDLPESQF